MSSIIFYSWQSDSPGKTNHSFIEQALEKVAKRIRSDETIEVEPVIDRDTRGAPGAPPIFDTILAEIKQSQVFVCDVTIINPRSKFRQTPNPNVAIELGYALKALGTERILMVINTAYGKPEEVPFDLGKNRLITYHMPEKETDRATERKELEKKLERQLRLIFDEISQSQQTEPAPIVTEAKDAVLGSKPYAPARIRAVMAYFVNEIKSMAPNFSNEVRDELLVQAINQSSDLAIEFAELAQIIAEMNDYETILAFYKGFEGIVNEYHLPRGVGGDAYPGEFDFYKFIGHEFFVNFFSFLLRENHWQEIANLLDEGIYIDNPPSGKPGMLAFNYIGKFGSVLLANRSHKQSQVSIQSEMLNERHTQGSLAGIVPMEQFIDADFFLSLRSAFWKPWSTLYMYHTPRYLVEASKQKYAEQMLAPLGVVTVSEFRDRVIEQKAEIARLFYNGVTLYVLRDFNPDSIGSID